MRFGGGGVLISFNQLSTWILAKKPVRWHAMLHISHGSKKSQANLKLGDRGLTKPEIFYHSSSVVNSLHCSSEYIPIGGWNAMFEVKVTSKSMDH